MSGRGPVAHLLAAEAIALAILVVFTVAGFDVSVWPWLLFGALGGAAWWVVGTRVPTAPAVGWGPPRADPAPMRFAADLQTRRTVTMIDDAQPAKGFTAVALTDALADRAAARLVRHHGLPADDPLAHAEGLLSPQLLDYLRRAGTERTRTVSPRTLRLYLKEIEAL